MGLWIVDSSRREKQIRGGYALQQNVPASRPTRLTSKLKPRTPMRPEL